MKKSLNWTILTASAFGIALTCYATGAWAAEGSGFTRESYDLIMRWVNFIILATLIIKYARRPIADFLKGKKDEVAVAIRRLEEKKKAAKDKLLECQSQLTASEERLTQIKQKIIAEGEIRKAEIIAGAQTDSRILLETAQLRIDHMIRETHERIKSEMIDTATRIAFTKLPGMLTAEDHNRMIRKWMDAVQS